MQIGVSSVDTRYFPLQVILTDLAILDEQREYFDWAVKLTGPKGVIYVDNVVRQLTDAEGDGSTKGRALIDHVKTDDRVMASLVPTLSTHKVAAEELVDGYLLAIKK